MVSCIVFRIDRRIEKKEKKKETTRTRKNERQKNAGARGSATTYPRFVLPAVSTRETPGKKASRVALCKTVGVSALFDLKPVESVVGPSPE